MKNNQATIKISKALQKMDNFLILLQVGLSRPFESKNLNFLALCNDGDIYENEQFVKCLLRKALPGCIVSLCDDSIRFKLKKMSGGIAIYNQSKLNKQFANWLSGIDLEGQRRPWAVGYWIPEALFGDIVNAKIIFDNSANTYKLNEYLNPYPTVLSKKITNFCINEINCKIKTLERVNTPLEKSFCFNDISSILIRLAFAKSKIYLRGFVNLEEQAQYLSPIDKSIYQLATEILQNKDIEYLVNNINKIVLQKA
jgi:hypothetical protein